MASRLLLFFLAAHVFIAVAVARSFPAGAGGTAATKKEAEPQFHGLPPVAGGPENAEHLKRPADRSMTGGEVILGGLATATFAVIICYIRVTRKRREESK